MLYEKTIRRSSSLDENERLMEAYNKVFEAKGPMKVSEFMSALESAIKKSFPKSLVRVQASKNLGSSIGVVFALGKDKSEWANGIIHNDPLESADIDKCITYCKKCHKDVHKKEGCGYKNMKCKEK